MKKIEAFYDEPTGTLTYIVWDSDTRDAVVIDPVLDYDPVTRQTSRRSLEKLLRFIEGKRLLVHWALDTHAHADHLTASRELCAAIPGCRWALGARTSEVFANFKRAYSWPESLRLENLGVSRWLRDQEEITAGVLRIQALTTPGHTPACLSYRIEDWLFTGDALMMPDSGVGRCDFPGGSASELYDSVWGKLYSLPDEYLVFVGHDYRPKGRPLIYRATLGEQKRGNIHLRSSTSKEEFVRFREGRDKTLSAPRLIDPSLDWNLGAHRLVPSA